MPQKVSYPDDKNKSPAVVDIVNWTEVARYVFFYGRRVNGVGLQAEELTSWEV